jgi:hypothetical protein
MGKKKVWDAELHVKKMMPLAKKLVGILKKNGVQVDMKTDAPRNVILSNDKKEHKVSFHNFFRYSGVSRVMKDVGKEVEYVKATDEMYMTIYMVPFLLMPFVEKKK